MSIEHPVLPHLKSGRIIVDRGCDSYPSLVGRFSIDGAGQKRITNQLPGELPGIALYFVDRAGSIELTLFTNLDCGYKECQACQQGYSQFTVMPCLVNGFTPRVGRRW